jgi:hypothetical protein
MRRANGPRESEVETSDGRVGPGALSGGRTLVRRDGLRACGRVEVPIPTPGCRIPRCPTDRAPVPLAMRCSSSVVDSPRGHSTDRPPTPPAPGPDAPGVPRSRGAGSPAASTGRFAPSGSAYTGIRADDLRKTRRKESSARPNVAAVRHPAHPLDRRATGQASPRRPWRWSTSCLAGRLRVAVDMGSRFSDGFCPADRRRRRRIARGPGVESSIECRGRGPVAVPVRGGENRDKVACVRPGSVNSRCGREDKRRRGRAETRRLPGITGRRTGTCRSSSRPDRSAG